MKEMYIMTFVIAQCPARMELHYERNVHHDTLPEDVSTNEMCYHWSVNFRADNYCFHGLHFTTVTNLQVGMPTGSLTVEFGLIVLELRAN